jgi:glycosyltransferase involved in cell wall biosynthesis
VLKETPLLLSIITPSYQQAAFLEETMQSVLNQNYPNLEYWVMDGGSTDGSREIIERYQSRLAGWISEPDAGQADAINKGLSRARGDVIGWINSDDAYLPGTFEQVAAFFQTHADIGLAYGDVLAVDGAGQPINLMTYAPWTVSDLLQFHMIGQSSVFFRRSLLEECGLLDAQYHYLLDHQLWIRMAARTKIAYVPSIWSLARYHADAKNIAAAAHFGRDAQRIVDWAANEPLLQTIWQQQGKVIQAGAYWLDAFYQADAGNPCQSLRAYGRVLWLSPARFFRDWKKILFTFLSWVGLKSITNRLEKSYRKRQILQTYASLLSRGLADLVPAQQETTHD